MYDTNRFAKIDMNLDTNFLKVVACICMLIDHSAKILFNNSVIMIIIGRMAFPLFAYCLVVGYLYTHDLKKYLIRLTIAGLVSQPIWVFATGYSFLQFNIFADLVMGLIFLFSIEEKDWILSISSIILVSLTNFDYGLNGLILILLFYVFRKNKTLSLLSVGVYLFSFFVIDISAPIRIFNFYIYIQGFAIMCLPLIYTKTNFNLRINKYFFYVFYPIHLLILKIIQLLILAI